MRYIIDIFEVYLRSTWGLLEVYLGYKGWRWYLTFWWGWSTYGLDLWRSIGRFAGTQRCFHCFQCFQSRSCLRVRKCPFLIRQSWTIDSCVNSSLTGYNNRLETSNDHSFYLKKKILFMTYWSVVPHTRPYVDKM